MRNRWNHTAPANTQPCPEDNTTVYIAEQVERYHHDHAQLLHPEAAMEIAAWWHGPSNPGFTAFSHTGTITADLFTELRAELAKARGSDARDLDALSAYVHACRPVLRFGYSAGLPGGTVTAWGARAIITQTGDVDLLPDRQAAAGAEQDIDALLHRLNNGVNAAWIERAKDMLRGYEMNTRKAEHFTLYADEHVTVVANTNGSAGYLYVAAYPTPAASIEASS